MNPIIVFYICSRLVSGTQGFIAVCVSFYVTSVLEDIMYDRYLIPCSNNVFKPVNRRDIKSLSSLLSEEHY